MRLKFRQALSRTTVCLILLDLAVIVLYCTIQGRHSTHHSQLASAATNSVVPRSMQFHTAPVGNGPNRGELEATGCSTDLAIKGNGFFIVKLPASMGYGRGYTRCGCLMLNQNGDLVVGINEGYRLMPRINIPRGASQVTISKDGIVEYLPAGAASRVIAGQIELAQFSHPENLWPEGNGIFTETVSSGAHWSKHPGEQGTGAVLSGFLEPAANDSVASVK